MPDQPDPPVTTLNGDNVEISWVEPGTGGSPVTFYQITVLQNDGLTYRPDLTNCDGSDATIFANRMCSIPVLYLKASPFYIEWAGSVYAKVVAVNVYGYSNPSEPGNGATLQTNPDAPIQVLEVFDYRTETDLGISWTDGFDGGTPIIYYEVQYDQGIGSWTTVATNNVGSEYVQTGLTIGEYYSFRVKARNDFD